MQLLPTIIIVSVLGFFIILTLLCIVWHWRKSRIPYGKRRQSLNAYRRSPVRRLTIQGGRVVDVSDALEKAGGDDDAFVDIPYPVLKAFVEPDDDPPSPASTQPRNDNQSISSNNADEKAGSRKTQPLPSSYSIHGGFINPSRDVHSIAIPAAFLTDRSGSLTLPRPALISIGKKTTSRSSKSSRNRERRETFPNERRARSKSSKNRTTKENPDAATGSDSRESSRRPSKNGRHGRQRSSAPDPRIRKSNSSSRVVSQAVPSSGDAGQADYPSSASFPRPPQSEPASKHTSSFTAKMGPPVITPRSSSYSAKRPPPLNLTPKPSSPTSLPRLSLIPPNSQRGSSHSSKRPPPLDLKPRSKSPPLQRPSPLGPHSKPPSPLTGPPSPVSSASKVSSPGFPPPIALLPHQKPKSPKALKTSSVVASSRASSVPRPPPLNLSMDQSTHVRFGPNKEAFLSTATTPATLSPSTIHSPARIIRAPPPSMTDLPLYRTPPPPTPGELEAELMPEMVARLDRPPSLDVDIPHTSQFSFFNTSNTPDLPLSADLRRGPSVMSNRSGITIASSEISSNWTIGNAELVNIYPSVGGSGGIFVGEPGTGGIPPLPTSHPQVPPSALSVGGSQEDRQTPPYAKTLRSKYGRYPRGRRDKALPTLPKSPLSMSFGLDYDDHDGNKRRQQEKDDNRVQDQGEPGRAM